MKNTNINKTNKLRLSFAVILFTLFFIYGTAGAAIQVLNPNGTGGLFCRDLIAGQSIDAGDVCVEVAGDDFVVTYTTFGGWELVEAHLWVGEDMTDLPKTKRGNPKIGNFPYNSGDITGLTSYSFNIPLSVFGTEAELCQDDKFVYIAAHSSLRKSDGSGGFQTETGWASGSNIVERGSWAMYFSIQFICDDVPPPHEASCETAFAFGNKKLWDVIDDLTGETITDSRWGWQNTVNVGSYLEREIYAGAGQNDITKGTHVGTLKISYDGSFVTVEFDMFANYKLDETHLYVGSSEIQTIAPGQFGNLHEDLGGAGYDSYSISVSGDPIYVVAHAVVCSPDFD